MSASLNMQGKRILITGAARGIGAETAYKLAGLGAQIAAVGLEPELLEGVAQRCGNGSIAIEADVSDREAITAAVDEAAERLGGLDVVMANAGIGTGGTVRTIDPDAFDQLIEINLMGVWRTNRAALPYIIASKGYILNVASTAAILHGPLMSAYCASKAAVEAFSDSLRVEVAHNGVDVGVAYYLWIDTDMVRDGDDIPAFKKFRNSLRGPAGKTLPVSAAVDATVEGIAKRSERIFVPGSLKWMQRLRGFPRLFDRDGRKAAPELVRLAEQRVAEVGARDASLSDRNKAIQRDRVG